MPNFILIQLLSERQWGEDREPKINACSDIGEHWTEKYFQVDQMIVNRGTVFPTTYKRLTF